MNDFDDYDDSFNGDDFYDDFNEDGDFMDDDSMEDAFDDVFGPDDSLDNDSEIEDEQSDEICEDEFTMEDAVITGIAYGWGYEEGLLEERKRRRIERKMNKDNDQDDL